MALLLLLFGVIDIIAGILMSLASELVFDFVSRYVGYALILKGVWSILIGLKG